MPESLDTPSALLLLPSPTSFDYDKVKEAFEPTISGVMMKLSTAVKESNHTASVDIALGIPDLLSNRNKPQAKIFKDLQHCLSSIYALIGAIAAARDLELDSPGGIDVRVVFVDYSPGTQIERQPERQSQFGPLLDMLSLAASDRRWDHVFYPDNEVGKILANCFLGCLSESSDLRDRMAAVTANASWKVSGSIFNFDNSPGPLVGIQLLIYSSQRSNLIQDEECRTQLLSTPHFSVAVGGTFDHLHLGHKLLLTATALVLEPFHKSDDTHERVMYIGITGDALLVNKKFSEFLEGWEDRYQSTAAFLSSIMSFSAHPPQIERVNERTIDMKILPRLSLKFVEITDPFGPTITEEDITALVVSAETHSGGAAVNDKRVEKGWNKLVVFEVDVLQSDASIDSKISSTDIRRRRMGLAKV